MKLLALAVVLVPLAGALGCDREPARRERPRDPQRERRVIEPPVGNVRPLPPHAIRADGVGPYRIGERLSVLLEQLPSGPRIAVFEIPGLLHRSLIRAEEDTVLIGGEPASSATFVAVVGPDVARTESGIHVGSTKGEVVAALGPITDELDSAHDPHVIVPKGLRNARIILHEDRVAAIVVSADSGTPARGTPTRDGMSAACPRPASTDRGFGACLTGGNGGELVEVLDTEVAIRAAETGRVIAAFKVPPRVVFVAPLRAPDGRDELVIVSETADAQQRRWSMVTWRFDGGKLAKTEAVPLYQVTTSNARWIGAELDEVELYLELSSHSDSVEVGGLLTTRPKQGPWRDVVVISPVSVPRRSGKSAPPEGVDAGTVDSAENPVDSAAGSDSTKP